MGVNCNEPSNKKIQFLISAEAMHFLSLARILWSALKIRTEKREMADPWVRSRSAGGGVLLFSIQVGSAGSCRCTVAAGVSPTQLPRGDVLHWLKRKVF